MKERHPILEAYKADYTVKGRTIYVGTPPTRFYLYPYYEDKKLYVPSYDFLGLTKCMLCVRLKDLVRFGDLDGFHEACRIFNVPQSDIDELLATS